MAHLHTIEDHDKHFVIDMITKKIQPENPEKNKLVRYDHNSERYTFEMDRMIEGHDMSLCDIIQIHYINIAPNKQTKNEGIYEVSDLGLLEKNDNKIAFTWLISRNATMLDGILTFAIRFACSSGDSTDYELHTEIFSSISISNTIYNDGQSIVEEYSDILNQWKKELFSIEGVIQNAKTESLDAINKSKTESLLMINKTGSDVLDSIREDGESSLSNIEKNATTQLQSIRTAGAEEVEKVQQVVTEINLQEMINDANQMKNYLDSATGEADTSKTQLSEAINSAEQIKTSLSGDIIQANTAKSNLDESVGKANTALQALQAENTSAESNLEELRGENFNSQEILAGVADLRAYLGLTDDDIVGVQVDYKNKTFKRIAGAVNLTKGADFDRFSMYGGRRKCTVADDGMITSWYGDADYAEDGSMGQVMVYQPKFYYLVCPVVYDPIETGIGYHLRKANYYVSEKARAGFRLHPAFYDAEGNEIDYFLTSAYEGSIWDADGGSGSGAYLMKDEQVMNLATDKFCSIAGVKPASGLTQNLTRPNIEILAKNRGDGWHGDLIKQVSAEQLLMIIEMGLMNMQTAIAQGIVSIADNASYNCSSLTGSTAALGNGTGRATETVNTKGDASTTETADEKTAVCWRGKENFWGNIWKFVYGVNIWGNGKMGGGQPYICNDFNFAESKNSGNYEGAGFTVSNVAGYISAMGYSTTCDWLFMASECTGNSSLPVGDYTYITQNLNAYRIARLGGRWNAGGTAGAFCWSLPDGVGYRYRHLGGRLVFIPTRGSEVYDAAIASWKEQMVTQNQIQRKD